MRRPNVLFTLARLWLVVGFGFIANATFDFGVCAQPASQPESVSDSLPTVTNLFQLSQLTGSAERLIADVRMDVTVCSASQPDIGVVSAVDQTGGEVLELGPHDVVLRPGDIIHLEAKHCLLRRRPLGVEILRAPVLDNDGSHGRQAVTAEVFLTAGLHPMRLDYFNISAQTGLRFTCRFPDGSLTEADHLMFRPAAKSGLASSGEPGWNVTLFDSGWIELPDYALLQPVQSVALTNITEFCRSRNGLFGVRCQGLFSAPVTGNYTLRLESNGGSRLFLDQPELPLAIVGHEEVPPPVATSLHTPMTNAGDSQWMSVEGNVTFVSKSGSGFRFELRSQPDSIGVMVADSGAMDPVQLLNCRVRVAGMGRAALAPSRDRMLGALSVASADTISILANPTVTTATTYPASLLVTVGQIQSLSKEQSAHHLPVRIQGVVTSEAPAYYRFLTLQDETRGIFVQVPVSTRPEVAVGDLCLVEGHTDAGSFAPMVVAEHVTVLGKGMMPPPAHPSWKELVTGKMDIQYIEFQGLVTAVKNNSVTLFQPEGDLDVELGGWSEAQLKTFAGAVIRIRGVLFAAWNTNRTVQVGHLSLRNININLDVPAPPDLFNQPVKNWRELYQFDSRATPFQRVKVAGTVIYAHSRWVFLLDRGRGIRVSSVEPVNLNFGDVVEVVGCPDISGPAPLLKEAIIRNTGQVAEPEPLVLDGAVQSHENVDSMLVRISATLTGIHPETDSQVLEMSAAGQSFLARLPDTQETIALQIGSQLMLDGVYVGKDVAWSEGGKQGGFDLLVNSSSQLQVLSKPSWWTPRRLLIMVCLLFAVLILSAIWISQLQHLVEQRTQELQSETREREIAVREQALETERSRIARDLHDDLGSSLTEISVLANKGQRVSSPGDLMTLFRSISAKARGLVTALDIIVWAVDPKDNSLESVADYLGDFASEYLSHSNIACRFDIPVALPAIVLEGRLRHGLLLAVKETLNNIERHAQATEVEFRMAYAQGQLEITITDNGKGFDKMNQRGGNGLRNLPLRLSKVGGRYVIDSSVGKGTVVTIGLTLLPPADPASMARDLSHPV